MNEKEDSNTVFILRLAQIIWTTASTSMLFLVYKIFAELI